jgi:hypothetical protein
MSSSKGAFAGFRILHNDDRLIAFELPMPNERMSSIKQIFENQKIVIHYFDGKIKVYSAPKRFDDIIRTLSVF